MGIARCAIAWDGVLGRRDDQLDIRAAGLADCLGRWSAVIGTVVDETARWTWKLGQQLGQCAGIADMLGGQAGRHNVTTLGVEADMQFTPCFPKLRQPVLLRHPVPTAMNPKPRTVDNERYRAVARSRAWCDLQRLGASVERREIRHRNINPDQPQKAAHEALCLTEGQTEHDAQGQKDLDRQLRIPPLSAAFARARGAPSCHCIHAVLSH